MVGRQGRQPDALIWLTGIGPVKPAAKRHNWAMRVSAKADYAVRAAAELAAAGDGRPLKREQISAAQKIPSKFLEAILLELKHAGIIKSTRGTAGGYSLARPAADISIADVIRAVDGPMATVRGERVESVEYEGPAQALRDVWVAVRASLRRVLETTSLADMAGNDLPPRVRELTADPDAWISMNRRRRPPHEAAARD
jgi:Rrf2 family protein